MPRRNLCVLLIVVAISTVCYLRADRYGRILVYAMNKVDSKFLEEVDRKDLFEGAVEGMINRLGDENSTYVSQDRLHEFELALDQEFAGIGVEVGFDRKTNSVTVLSPLVGSPAYKAGVRAGDEILRIDGKSTKNFSFDELVSMLLGKPGESVNLTIKHQDATDPIDVEVVRGIVRVDTILGDARNADGSWNYFLSGHDKIGYIRINSFGEKTIEEFQHAIEWLVDHKMRGLILDLRNDPGGLLDASIAICDAFIDSGLIVTTRGRDQKIDVPIEANVEGTYLDFPIAIIVNQYSASASEIVAACLQDHKRAIVVGQRTYGKGTVQEVIDLGGDNGKLKLTTASYWRPSGKNIHRHKNAKEDADWGVSPDSGYEVIVEGEKLAKLLKQRRNRDLAGPLAEKNGKRLGPIDDPQLKRATDYIKEKTSSK